MINILSLEFRIIYSFHCSFDQKVVVTSYYVDVMQNSCYEIANDILLSEM